ncbi:hypothetical protein [Nemorincola caseinilytica]
MQRISIVLYCSIAALILLLASCRRHRETDIVVRTGIVERQGMTTYQYGTHILVTANDRMVLKSKLDLDKAIGKKVTITAVGTHSMVENGPPLYTVIAIQ